MFTAKGCLRWVRIVGEVEIQEGQPVRRFGLWQDITDEKAMVDRIHSFAQRDDLTGLFNRKALRDKLGEIAGADLSSQKSVATAVVRYARNKPDFAGWVNALLARRPARVVTVAVANKLARIVWAIMQRGGSFRERSFGIA